MGQGTVRSKLNHFEFRLPSGQLASFDPGQTGLTRPSANTFRSDCGSRRITAPALCFGSLVQFHGDQPNASERRPGGE
jgi:hypothetical protein